MYKVCLSTNKHLILIFYFPLTVETKSTFIRVLLMGLNYYQQRLLKNIPVYVCYLKKCIHTRWMEIQREVIHMHGKGRANLLYRGICKPFDGFNWLFSFQMYNWVVNFPLEYIIGWTFLNYNISISHIFTAHAAFFIAKNKLFYNYLII